MACSKSDECTARSCASGCAAVADTDWNAVISSDCVRLVASCAAKRRGVRPPQPAVTHCVKQRASASAAGAPNNSLLYARNIFSCNFQAAC